MCLLNFSPISSLPVLSFQNVCSLFNLMNDFALLFCSSLCFNASLIVQLVKIPPAMQETLVQFLGQEDSLEKGWVIQSRILVLPLWLSWWRIPGLGRSSGERKGYPLQYCGELHGLYSPWGRKELDTSEQLSLSCFNELFLHCFFLGSYFFLLTSIFLLLKG